MKPRSTILLISFLMIAVAVGWAWLHHESPADTDVVIEQENSMDDESSYEPESQQISINELIPNDPEPIGFGNLVITLHDFGRFPVIGEEVQLTSIGHEVEGLLAITDDEGEVTFESLPEGGYLYTIEQNGSPPLVASAPVVILRGETLILDLQLPDHDRSISGKVVDRNGAPVADLEITARLHKNTDSPGGVLKRVNLASALSDTNGRFEIEELQASDYEIEAEADGRYLSASVIVRAGTGSALLKVGENRVQHIEGTVTNSIGEPLAGVRVAPPPGSSATVFTDLQGHYTLTLNRGLVVGRSYFRFLLAGYQETRLALVISKFDQAESLTIDATLSPVTETVTVSGRVTDEHGQAIAGEQVQLHSRSRYTTYRTTSGTDGEFMIIEVAVGDDYRVWLQPQQRYADYNQTNVALTDGQSRLDIILPFIALGTVRGRVLDELNQPVSDFHFWIRSANAEGRVFNVTADIDGWFEVEKVPTGQLTLGSRSQPLMRITGFELIAGVDQYIEVVLVDADSN